MNEPANMKYHKWYILLLILIIFVLLLHEWNNIFTNDFYNYVPDKVDIYVYKR